MRDLVTESTAKAPASASGTMLSMLAPCYAGGGGAELNDVVETICM